MRIDYRSTMTALGVFVTFRLLTRPQTHWSLLADDYCASSASGYVANSAPNSASISGEASL